ncbi:hypothetical protein [Brevibacillus sp. SYSU BS000544]|uniref:hypothetical protein n=1 Tax=Brevibacillus sp. SYSU BS000544 TaxID=3416443 RepID=UPI003CE53613
MRNFIDSLFNPASQFLQGIRDSLLKYSVGRNKPIELDSFFSPFALLGTSWVVLIKAVMLSLFSITMLYVAIGARGVYLYFKESIKWW